jgi:hypothetical protein
MWWTRRHRARKGIAGRDQLRERSSGRADERCRSVRQNRVDLTPQWSASSLRKASRPDRARMSQLSAGDGGEKSPILRGEREISRQTIAQGMSDVLRCPVCSCAFLLVQFAHETAGAARIRHSLLLIGGRNNRQSSGRWCRENANVYREVETSSGVILRREPLRASKDGSDEGARGLSFEAVARATAPQDDGVVASASRLRQMAAWPGRSENVPYIRC